jgi:hypothetical protein
MKIIIDNDGDAIFLHKENIKSISKIKSNSSYLYFNVNWIDGAENSFIFEYSNYDMDKDILLNKISKIRLDILSDLNGGINPEIMFPEINLKKEIKLTTHPNI